MASAVTVYGIKNCDTMKKARAWLDERGVAYRFHDYKSGSIAKKGRFVIDKHRVKICPACRAGAEWPDGQIMV